ncbi:MAG: sigma-54-dependent transcriptional regulator [candidate division WOR-3 bacterium]|jgi:two-component system NtrC family response regulator
MRILLVDDEVQYCELTAANLRSAGYEVAAVTSGVAALELLRSNSYDVVITDLKMAPVDGLAILTAVKQNNPDTEVVIITGYGTISTAVEAMRQGAYDFITKPVAIEHLLALLEKIKQLHRTRQENRILKQELKTVNRYAGLVGESPVIKKLLTLIQKVAASDATVLITGESGTGKELVARLIHNASPRAQNPLLVVHAAALPETLLESELFGYEKGAFTGAVSRKPGRLEQADGGTLFLDEIGEISPQLQIKLLRFLQDRTAARLGGNRTYTVNTRIIAATNRNLTRLISEGKFREDLYYRLAVFPIAIPPLREHKEDIPALCNHILNRFGYHRPLSREVINLLFNWDWPGNVRELENVLERALILSAGEEIKPHHIQFPERATNPQTAPQNTQSLPALEKLLVEEALKRTGGNKSKAAELLGITRRMLYTKIARYKIKDPASDRPL